MIPGLIEFKPLNVKIPSTDNDSNNCMFKFNLNQNLKKNPFFYSKL